METLRSVWIDESCIFCDCCEGAAPQVFHVDGGPAVVRGGVRVDGITSMNEERSPLNGIGIAHHEAIIEAAAGCPVEAIRLVME